MKILYLVNGLADAGAELGLATLVERGFFRGHDLTVWAIVRDRGQVCHERLLQSLGAERVRVLFDAPRPRPWHLILAAARLWIALGRERIDLVIASLPHADLVARVGAMLSPRTPLVTFVHSTTHGWLEKLLLRPLGFRVSAVLYDDPETFGVCPVVVGRRPKPGFYVPLAALKPRRAPRPPAGGPERRLLSLGRLIPVKNHAELLQAMSILVRKGHRLHLTIGGDGPLRGELMELSRSLGLGDRVAFAGFVADPDRLRDACDVYVQSSRHEGLCLAVLEAMARGMLVVATDVGGMRTYGIDGVNMFKAAAPTGEALAAALEAALEAGQEGEAVRRAAIETVERHFSPAAAEGHWRAAAAALDALHAGR